MTRGDVASVVLCCGVLAAVAFAAFATGYGHGYDDGANDELVRSLQRAAGGSP